MGMTVGRFGGIPGYYPKWRPAVTRSRALTKRLVLDNQDNMAEPAPPVPPENAPTYIDTSSPNNVRVWIRRGIAEGRLKDCANLGIDQIIKTRESAEERVQKYSYFIPNCVHRSFVSNHSHLSDESQGDFLRYSLQTNPLSCPSNCCYYENRRWSDLKSRVRFPFVALFRFAKAMLKGYSTLAWQTQVTLIAVPGILLILWKAPNWVPQIVALAKALWGKE
jgi:hypothetical protein